MQLKYLPLPSRINNVTKYIRTNDGKVAFIIVLYSMKVCFMDGWINRVKTLSLELNQRESESSIYSDLVVGRTSEAIEFQMV